MGPQQQLLSANTLLNSKRPKVTVMHKHFSFKGSPNFTGELSGNGTEFWARDSVSPQSGGMECG